MGSALMMVRGDFIKDMAIPAYAFVLLLLVLVPLSERDRRQQELASHRARTDAPSEFAKFTTALVLTHYLSGLKSFSGCVR